MDCRRLQRLLSPYLDDSLSDQKTRAVREHLTGCDDCRAELHALLRTTRTLQLGRNVEPSVGFTERTVLAARREAVRRRAEWQQMGLRVALATAMVVMVLLSGMPGAGQKPVEFLQFQGRVIREAATGVSTTLHNAATEVNDFLGGNQPEPVSDQKADLP